MKNSHTKLLNLPSQEICESIGIILSHSYASLRQLFIKAMAMPNKKKKLKALRYQQKKTRRAMSYRSKNYQSRLKQRLANRRNGISTQKGQNKNNFINIKAPDSFSFVDNTNEVLRFFKMCKNRLHTANKTLLCDISAITSLSSDAIALLAACANDMSFLGNSGRIMGNAPQDPELLKLFVESGFYNYVNADKTLKGAHRQDKNLFHQESNYQVQSEIAKRACILGANHVFGKEEPLRDLYEMLIEAMSNTNNHANCKSEKGQIKWWLYTYNDPNGHTMYTFVDLGVGIFESIPAQKYKIWKKLIGLGHNVDIVEDLLSGKIKSRKATDGDIRGKGIPQIANNSSNKLFARAYIISNNVKINLKDRTGEKLKSNFYGTLLFWELTNKSLVV